MMRFWCGVVSRDHIQRGIAGGFCQVCHGRRAPLAQIAHGDGIVFYSPTIQFGGPERCQHSPRSQQFSMARPYQVQMTQEFMPFRRDVSYLDAHAVDIHVLLDRLEFAGVTATGDISSASDISNCLSLIFRLSHGRCFPTPR